MGTGVQMRVGSRNMNRVPLAQALRASSLREEPEPNANSVEASCTRTLSTKFGRDIVGTYAQPRARWTAIRRLSASREPL